ncbi:Fur-regulated basic protein FbpA [Enterocloster clostridioformis]
MLVKTGIYKKEGRHLFHLPVL